MMVLVGYGANDNKYEKKVDWMVCHFDCKHLHHTTSNTYFLSLCNKESVVVSPVITFHTLRKKLEIKTVWSAQDSVVP